MERALAAGLADRHQSIEAGVRPAATREAVADLLLEVLPGVHHLLREAVEQAPQIAGMTLAQFRLLKLLNVRDYRATELACAARVSPPTLTAEVDGLERRGLVERLRTVPGDRRAVLLRLTPAGRSLCASLRTRTVDALLPLLAATSDGERHHLAEGLQALHAVLAAPPEPGLAAPTCAAGATEA